MDQDLDQLCINTIRTLSMDAVQKANSGHPGTPMALAPAAYTLWNERLRYDPADPLWPDRDRFVLSCGHASMLLYSLLHLTKTVAVARYEATGKPTVSLDDIKHFRQLDSSTPGHPEYHMTTGVEATTGPLGQGVGMATGMAIAGRWMAQRFNRPGFPIVNHSIFSICSDGDLMEGVASEAASIAGHLRLSNLCWIYDSNQISIEGSTNLAFTEDVATRFLAYGWNVLHVRDANDQVALRAALHGFDREQSHPTMIVMQSHIGYGAPTKHDSREAHGEPLGEDEVRGAKRFYGWPENAHFLVPDGVYQHFADGIGKRGAALSREWKQMFERYRAEFPDLAREFEMMRRGDMPAGCADAIPNFPADAGGMATRDSSGKVMNAVAAKLPWLLPGSADLAPSTKTDIKNEPSFERDNYAARNFHFGIREHGMGAICNGMALCGTRPLGSTFLIFSDYMRGAVRLSALMEVPVVWVFTHDSIGLGEDGPTHQPVEQLAGLRGIPGLLVIRPCDANEVAEAWRVLLGLKHEPAALVLTRQKLPTLDRTKLGAAAGLARGAYVLSDPPDGAPEVILIGTGSEIWLCLDAQAMLAKQGVRARVVSMPCWELFEKQDQAYRDQVLPPDIRARVAVEAASTLGWERYVGMDGSIIGMRSFGASAPIKMLLDKFGFTAEKIAAAAKSQRDRARGTGRAAH